MNRLFSTKKLFLFFAFFLAASTFTFSQNIAIGNFDDYINTDSLKAHWRVFGFSSLDFALHIDSTNSPMGTRYLDYVYSGNDQTTWGGALERTDLASAPLDLSSANKGIQFYLKGDGTSNKIYVRFSNGTSNWASNFITLADTNWHTVLIPLMVDTANGFTNGSLTDTDLQNDLANVTDFRIYIDHPTIDNISYTIGVSSVYAIKALPPDGIVIDDFENYNTTSQVNAVWQFFGFSTADYNLRKDAENSPLGFKYLDYKYRPGTTTTWGSAFRLRAMDSTDMSGIVAGIQFNMKGDGTDNHLYFRLDNGNEMWASYFIPLKDTTWHLVKIGFFADTLVGFRYVGNDPNNGPVFSSNIGTTEELYNHLKGINGLRIVVDKPVKDDILRDLNFDAFYAVNAFSDGTVLPVELTSFNAINLGSSVKLQWTTATEINNRGFEVQRKLNSAWETLGFINGQGTSTKSSTYFYEDNISNINSSSISYRLRQVDFDGSFSYSKEVNVSKTVVHKYELSQNYPNPFNPATQIKYGVAKEGLVTIKVYNILGKEVATLINEIKPAGNYEIKFNASQLSSGVYFYSLHSGDFTQTKKLILLK